MKKIDIKNWIKKCESCVLTPYFDTEGIMTIGWGRNLRDNGIRQDEADLMFDNDFDYCEKMLSHYDWYIYQPDSVQAALINMCFNLGITRLKGFKRMIAALENKNYALAAKEALNSKWATQVGQRAKDVALMIREAK